MTTRKQFDPRKDQLVQFEMPELFAVAVVIGPPGVHSLHIYATYDNRPMADWHCNDLLTADRKRRAELQRKLDADNRGEIGLSLAECKAIVTELSYAPRDIRVLSSKNPHVKAEVVWELRP